MLMQIKDVNIKTLVSGDKSGRIILEVIHPEDIAVLKDMLELNEIEVKFTLPKIDKQDSTQ
jgi:hypothetical protein